MRSSIYKLLLITSVLITVLPSCNEGESYSELLRTEQKAVNWYLSGCRVETKFPGIMECEKGDDAPFYKMDAEGYLYMQVVNPGDLIIENEGTSDEKWVSPIENNQVVWFRFMRRNIKSLYKGLASDWVGNADNMNSTLGNTYLVYGNTQLPSTTQFGTGIQVPLKYVGYNSEVNLVISSYQGFETDKSSCIPYLMNIKYFEY